MKSFDDVVFQGRNKKYGAYNLRKNYSVSVFVAVLISTLLLLVAVSMSASKPERKIDLKPEITTTVVELPEPPEQKEVLPELPKSIERSVRFTAPVVVNELVEEDTATISFEASKPSVDTTGGGHIVYAEKKEIVEPTKEKEEVFMIVGIMPSFPGGEDGLHKFLALNVKYPQMARETKIKGNVITTFVVEKDGSITGISLLKDIGGGCGAEAIRVVSIMPRWIPGRQNDKYVRVQFNLPILFTLE